jgi:hypothetical protein
MNKEKSLITWNESDAHSKALAFEQFAEAGDAYTGVSKGNHYRDFKDIEPNRSVRPGYTLRDYYSFRPEERPAGKQKRVIKMCMDAYDKVGIIRNVIDLMGDFGCQGINIVHENKSVEKFYQQWFKKIGGKERSERFLNTLYRTGQVICYRSFANITPEIVKYIKSMGSEITVELPEFDKNQIPWRYTFFNPLTIDTSNGNINLFLGRRDLEITVNTFLDNFKDGEVPQKIINSLPPDIQSRVKKGERKIPLDPKRLAVFFYKKDDWNNWANPLIYAILDDIIMLEKMRLADLSALDGAISNIRLWTLGDLDHKILPNKAAINKLRDILASNVGGGTMDLVWGPELKFSESNSQIYKFLGSEKYQSVLNSIYAGLGVPPTLTGIAGQSGGFTNNFISLKTLVERLQYGRDQLTLFWERECEIVRKAMGFRKSPHIMYDQMSLSDESSEKNLLIQLADRDIISHETILERFKEVPSVEKMRLKREDKDRTKDNLPEKASPFHNPNHNQDMEKIDRQGEINEKIAVEKEKQKPAPAAPQGGRPANKQDSGPRKKRVDTPRSKPGVAELMVWTNDKYDKISRFVNEAYLSSHNKKNMRNLTKAEVADIESIKLDILSNVKLMGDCDVDEIVECLNSQKRLPSQVRNTLKSKNISPNNMSLLDYQRRAISAFIEHSLGS